MRIGFVDPSNWDYHVESVDEIPLGGSQSAACHLARALARRGHDVFHFGGVSAPRVHAGVDCRNLSRVAVADAHALALDVVVCVLAAGMGKALREIFAPRALVLWNQHAHDQPAVQSLKDASECAEYDGFAMVSDWQREQFARCFPIDPDRMAVRRNAIAPPFQSMFPSGQPILEQKSDPPVLAYTSTPFRGLNLLLEAWPAIRSAVPGARLQVYSSMRIYQTSAEEDNSKYGELYAACRQTEGIEYHGSIPQPALAERLRRAAMLAYPNTFAETSCIAVMEAMASGCRIVTSELGALPETTAGFAELIGMTAGKDEFVRQFIDKSIHTLTESRRRPEETETLLRRQVDAINVTCTWEMRADEWLEWFGLLCDGRKPAAEAKRSGRATGILSRLLRRTRNQDAS
jgi:glycosyltransferase involved in cell wall biosynthesis